MPRPDPPRSDRLESERALIAAVQAGDDAARDELVARFMPAIGTIAHRYRNARGLKRSELMQQGVVGLLRAVVRYDPTIGSPFWAYASCWVRREMQQLVSELALPVALSDRGFRHVARVSRARRELACTQRAEPSTGQLAAATGLTRGQVEQAIAANRPARSLQEPLTTDADDTSTWQDTLADPDAEAAYQQVLDRIRHEALPYLTAVLTERERCVITARYGFGCPRQTLREIGAEVGVSAERIRQIEEEALNRMRIRAAGTCGAR
jgi:RNA polymerase primary sigma factor